MAANPKHRKVIGESIRVCRKSIGLSQEKLAEKADLHPVYISQVERAQKGITVDALVRVAKALGVRVTDLMGGL